MEVLQGGDKVEIRQFRDLALNRSNLLRFRINVAV